MTKRPSGRRVTLRPRTAADAAFLRELHHDACSWGATRDDVSGTEIEAFLDLRHVAREQRLAQAYPHASDEIIEQDGRPVGRLLHAGADGTLHVVELTVLRDSRGQGVATAALRAWTGVADQLGRAVSVRVPRGDGAVRLYARLGFFATDYDEHWLYLRRPPSPKTSC